MLQRVTPDNGVLTRGALFSLARGLRLTQKPGGRRKLLEPCAMANRPAVDPKADAPPIFFREWREHRGLTQEQVQKLFGWGEGRLSKLESGVVPAKPTALALLARVYGCDIGDLFKPPPAPAVDDSSPRAGLFGIVEMCRLIARLQEDIAELRRVVVPRIEAIEQQVNEAGVLSETAARNAEELAELFARYASQLPRHRPVDE